MVSSASKSPRIAPLVDSRQQRVAKNEALFRRVNERIEEINETLAGDSESDFLCECGNDDCTSPVSLTLAEYEEVRRDPTHFLIAHGHEVVDVRTMDFEEAFDIILCLYVLEHVFELDDAVRSIHRALTPGGFVVIAVPHLYPYHDEPTDYWRFTEHALRQLLAPFDTIQIKTRGFGKMPLALLAIARKQGGS